RIPQPGAVPPAAHDGHRQVPAEVPPAATRCRANSRRSSPRARARDDGTLRRSSARGLGGGVSGDQRVGSVRGESSKENGPPSILRGRSVEGDTPAAYFSSLKLACRLSIGSYFRSSI